MTAQPLTDAQQMAVDALVVARKVAPVPSDLAKCHRFLDQAGEALEALTPVRSSNVRYDVSYNAAHDVGEAMLAAYGFRTASGQGRHVAVGEFLEAVFDHPPAQIAARNYNRLRAARNGLRYQARPAGSALADLAVSAATDLLAAARDRTT
jgi:hypothetical protein